MTKHTNQRVTRKMIDAWLAKFRPDLESEIIDGERLVFQAGKIIARNVKWGEIAAQLGAKEVRTNKIESFDRAVEIMSENFYGPEAYAEASKIIVDKLRDLGNLPFTEAAPLLDWLEDGIGLLHPAIDTPEKLLNQWKNHRLKLIQSN